jgi:hypothetical protein
MAPGLAMILLVLAGQAATPARPAPPALHGVVVNAKTAAPIADARVLLVELARSTKSDADGRFSFATVPPGRYTLTVSMIGYIFVHRQVNVGASAIALTLPLTEGTGAYQENVTITATTAPPREIGVASQSDVGSAGLQDLRGVAAVAPMRAMQALPGVATGDDFQSQFSVRGSSFRHVGIVIDGTATPLLLHTVRNTNDTGSVAMINTDVLERASLMAGPHPQRHGDWVGATLQFDLRDGSRDRSQLRGAVSGTSASMVLEGPLGPSRHASWIASIRRSYVDWLIRKIDPNIDSTLGFSDAQAKVVYDLTNRQQLQFTAIGGDATYRDENTGLANGLHTANSKSVLGSGAWRYTRNAVLFSQRVSFIGSKFKDLGLVGQELGTGYGRGVVWRGDATWFVNKSWALEAGAKSEWQHQTLTERNFQIVNQQPRQRFIAASASHTNLASGWGELSRHTAATGFSIGARVTRDSLSARTVVSPWLLGEWTAGRLTARVSGGVAHQFPELELQRALPERVAERARMIDAGLDHQLPHGLRWQLTAFGREDANVLRRSGEDRIDGGRRFTESVFPMFTSTLGGRSRGVDVLFARRATTGLTGWIAYTYAHTRYHDRVIGEEFDGDFDQRHTVNVFVQERLSYRTAVSAKLRMGSNFPLVGYFQGTLDALHLGTRRNQIRLPSYARLDIRANRTYTFDRRRLTLFLELMNATGRRNLGQAAGFIRGATFEAIGYTEKLIPFVPSVGMLIEF